MQRVTTGIRMQAFQSNAQPQYVAQYMPHALPQTPFMARPSGMIRPTPRWTTSPQVKNKRKFFQNILSPIKPYAISRFFS